MIWYNFLMKQKKKKTEQDTPWKDIVETFFPQFLEFFFPDIHRDIDFTKKYEWLDKELQKIQKESKIGKRLADKLVKVFLKDGSERWLLLHIEVQSTQEENFAERVYVYNYRIFDRYHKEVISLVILTDKSDTFRPGKHEINRWGFKLTCEFPVIKILDYRGKIEELEKSSNPFALVILIYLNLYEAKEDIDRFQVKLSIARSVYNTGKYTRKEAVNLLRFIDWLIILPEELEKKFTEEIEKLEEVNKMPYVTTFEKYGYKKGIKEGIQKGKLEGKLEGKTEIAERLYKKGYSIESISDITGLAIEDVKKLARDLRDVKD